MFQLELFDITKAQAEPEVEPYGVADNLNRKPVVLVSKDGWRCVHAAPLPHRKNAQHAVKANCSYGADERSAGVDQSYF